MHHLFYAHLIDIFLFLTGVELRYFFPLEMLRGCLVCVICKSYSIRFFIVKLCIMNVHTLKMCTFDFVYISRIFIFMFCGLELRHISDQNA